MIAWILVAFLYLVGMIEWKILDDHYEITDGFPIWRKVIAYVFWPVAIAVGFLASLWDDVFTKKWN